MRMHNVVSNRVLCYLYIYFNSIRKRLHFIDVCSNVFKILRSEYFVERKTVPNDFRGERKIRK